MSLVFRIHFVKLYPDVDRRCTYFLAKSNQPSIVDVSIFMLAMFMSKNCSCLVSMSDDLDENVKAATMLTAVFDIGDISSILSCQIIAH